MVSVRLTFERGGSILAELDEDLAPTTCKVVLSHLPLDSEALHTRWCGREIYFPVGVSGEVPVPENQTTQTSKGDVIYWREWEKASGDGPEIVALYYGPEVTRDHRGYLKVNVFGRVLPEFYEDLRVIGERVWQQGKEKVRIELVQSEELNLIGTPTVPEEDKSFSSQQGRSEC